MSNLSIGQALRWLGTLFVTVLTLGAAGARRRTRPGRMGQALSVFTFVVIGAAIVAVAWWYFMTLRDAIFADKRAYVLGEVEVVGNSEVAETYKKVLSVLSEYAKHQKMAPFLGDEGQVELSALSDRLRDAALRFSRWRDLQWFAAEISEEAKKWEDANAYYTNLAAVTPDDHPDRRLIDEKLQFVEAELQRIIAARAEATRRGVDAQTVLDEQTLNRRAAASNAVADVANPIRQLLGLTAALDATGQIIGIVGLPWEESLNGLDYEFLDGAPGNLNDSGYRDYATELVQSIRLITDNARYVFVPVLGDWNQGSMADALDKMGEIQDLNVVLFAYTLPAQSAILNDAIRNLAEKVVVVLSAGNTPGDSIYSGVADVAMVTGSVTQTGAPATFTSKTKNMVWAPGVDVPLISPNSGAIEKRSGTAYSSAFAAAAAAILTNRSPNASPPMIFSALRETAKPAEGRTSPPIINIPAATEVLDASPANPDAG